MRSAAGTPGRVVRAVVGAGAVGAGLALGGVVLGLYSRFMAETVAYDEVRLRGRDWFGAFHEETAAGLAERFGLAAVLLGVIVVAVCWAIGVWRHVDSYQSSVLAVVGFIAVLAVILVLAGLIAAGHLPGIYTQIRFEYPYFPRLPTAAAASVLVLAGALLVLGSTLIPNPATLLRRRALVAAAVGGLVISAGTAVLAVRAGDDRPNIDHVTASAVEILSAPQHLGTERYRAQFVNGPYERLPDIVAAGAGFVVAELDGLTAYDGRTGTQRWHYRRPDFRRGDEYGVVYRPETLLSVADGRVVLANWDHLGWRAFDAVTGEKLWTETDFTRDRRARMSVPRSRNPSGFLILSNESRIARYDARTGSRMWSADFDAKGCDSTGVTALLTDHTIYRVADCAPDKTHTLTVSALDPLAGAVSGIRELARTDGRITSRRQTLANTLLISWGFPATDRAREAIVLRGPDQLHTAAVTEPRDESYVAAEPNGPDVLVEPYGARWPQVVDIDSGAVRFETSDLHYWDTVGSQAEFLSAEIVQSNPSSGKSGFMLRSWSRADGAPAATRHVTSGDGRCYSGELLPVSGALLALCRTLYTTEIVGFR